MICLSQRTRRRIAQGLLAVMGYLWLVAAASPCVMTASYCPNMQDGPCEAMAQSVHSTDDDSLEAMNCHHEEAALTSTSAPDTQPVPALLVRLPAATTQAIPVAALKPDRLALQFSPPPLYLQHAVLLI